MGTSVSKSQRLLIAASAVTAFVLIGCGEQDEYSLVGAGAHDECETPAPNCTTMVLKQGPITDVALDDAACIVLGRHELKTQVDSFFEPLKKAGISDAQGPFNPYSDVTWPLPTSVDLDYRSDVNQHRIVPLRSGTKVKQLEIRYSRDGRLVPPASADEKGMHKRLDVAVTRVLVQEGDFTGRTVCLPTNRITPRFGPSL